MYEIDNNEKSFASRASLPLVSIGLILGYFISQAMSFVVAGEITGQKITEMSMSAKFISISANSIVWIVLTAVIIPKLELPKFDNKQVKEHLKTYFAGVGLLYLCMFFFGIILQLTDFKPKTQEVAEQVKMMSQTSIFLVILGPALLIPIIEEILFRSLLFRSFKASMSPFLAAVISAVLFGLAHIEPDTIPQLITIGLVLAYVYEKSGSIFVPIALHATNNFITVMILIYGKEIKEFLKSLTQAV